MKLAPSFLTRAVCLLRPMILAAVVLAAPGAFGQDDAPDAQVDGWRSIVESAEARLSDPTLSDFAVERWIDRLEALSDEARNAASLARDAAVPIASQLEALGPPPEDGSAEDETLSAERAEIQAKLAAIQAVERRAEAIAARAEQSLIRFRDWRRTAFAERLLTRAESPLKPDVLKTALVEIAAALRRGSDHHETIIRKIAEAGLLPTAVIIVTFGIALAAALIWLLRRVVITRLIASVSPETGPMRKLLVGIGLAMSRLIIPLTALAAVDLSLERFSEFGVGDIAALTAAVEGAVIVIVVYALAFTYYAPKNPTLRLADLDESRVRRAASWAVVIAVIAAADRLTLAVADLHSLANEALYVVNLAFVSGGAFAFWRFIALNRSEAPASDVEEPETAEIDDDDDEPAEDAPPPEVSLSRVARTAAIAIAAFAPLAAVIGFYALSRYALSNIILTTALFGTCALLYAAVKSAASALAQAAGAEHRASGESEDFSLAPIVFGTFLAIAALPMVALIWGVTQDDLLSNYRSLADGVSFGEFRFSPMDLVLFAVVFVIGVVATRTVQSIMRGSILPKTRMDAGAQASLVSGVGYVGFSLAALTAVGAAGLDLSNIAIVAGALSVGIGFGLQNVVNNFVSGIILLIERPVKIGDWIVVGGEHGYVRKINVRSTEIQTFDRTTLIVPNSELISQTVTNYTHNDLIGRVKAPVGVAYGSDTREVERILTEIGRASPYLRRYPSPQVLFMGFGDSSLDFELRGFLRDVNDVLVAHSAINFEIDRRFREASIEIPFPQRDLNLRDLDRLTAAMRRDPEPGTG